MSDNISIEIDSRDLADFQKILQSAESQTRRKMPNLVKQATIWTVQSLRASRNALTPISKKLRDKTPKGNPYGKKNPEAYASGKAGKGKHYGYKIWHYEGNRKKGISKGRKSFWRTNNPKSPRRKISYRGAARAGWVGVLRRMGKGTVRPEGGRRLRQVMYKASRFRKGGGETTPFMEFANMIRYVGKIAPNSVRIALTRTGNRLQKQLERDIEKMGFND